MEGREVVWEQILLVVATLLIIDGVAISISCGEYVNAVITTLQERSSGDRAPLSVSSDDKSYSLIAINTRRGVMEVGGE